MRFLLRRLTGDPDAVRALRALVVAAGTMHARRLTDPEVAELVAQAVGRGQIAMVERPTTRPFVAATAAQPPAAPVPAAPAPSPAPAPPPAPAPAPPPLAVPELVVDDPKAVAFIKGKKTPTKLKLVAETKQEGTDNAIAFDGKATLTIEANADKIELFDAANTKLTPPVALTGAKLKPRLEFYVTGVKPSGAKDDITIKYALEKTGAVGVGATASVTASLSVVEVLFCEDPAHDWGFDAFETIAGEDHNDAAVTENLTEEYSFLSVEKSGVGKVKYEIKGAAKEDIYFTCDDETIAKPKTPQPSALTGTLEIEGQTKAKVGTILSARYRSSTGIVLAQLGIAVFEKLTFEAEFFRVKDNASPGTSLSLSTVTGAILSATVKQYYKQAVSELKIIGGASELSIDYDTNAKSTTNGALDLEPGKQSDEQKLVLAGCVATKTPLVYVKKLRWSYYLRADASAGDTTVKLRNYGSAYLGYIGTKGYTIEDTAGHKETVTVTAVNRTTGDITIAPGLTNSFTKANKSALLWPLGGLSGDPVWVADKSTVDTLANYAAHELGHQLAGYRDVCEKDNLMFGGSTTGTKLRHRALKNYYDPSQSSTQWSKMKGRT